MAKFSRKNGATSNIIRLFIQDTSVTSSIAGKTGLTFSSSGLIISTLADVESSATTYTVAGSTIETISTLGTFAAPTATKCRFKEVDATNHPGLYEIQIADARFAVSSAKTMIVTIQGVANAALTMAEIELTAVDAQSSTAFITGVNSLAPPTNWNLTSIDGSGRLDIIKIAGTSQTARDLGASVLLSSGTGTGQVSLSSGLVSLSGTQTFNVTGNITGNLSGSVGSVTGAVGSVTGAVGSVTGAVGSISGITFPTNFASLLIGGTGHITIVDTVTTYTGNTVQTGDAYARLGAPAGASHAADVAAVKTDTAAVKVQTDKLAFTVANQVDSNALSINGSATAASRLGRSALAIVTGACSGSPSTTNLPTTGLSPAAVDADQFKGRILTFDSATATTNLRGEATDITASSNTGVLTVTALSTAPASGDTFTIT